MTITTSDNFTVKLAAPEKRSLVMILASSLDSTIGKDNGIPWNCKTDMTFFRRATIGNVVIMGRKTFESMNNKPLPNRVNIIVSKTLQRSVIGADTIVVSSLFEALKHARTADLSLYKRFSELEHIFIIGGVELYTATAKICDELLISTIDLYCGARGYGYDCIINHLLPRFTKSANIDTEVLYFNDGSVATDDVDKLREIRHCHNINSTNQFRFKGQ